MQYAVIYDCECLTSDGAWTRMWCGPLDPDPILVQIGAVKVALTDGLPVVGEFQRLTLPINRWGILEKLDPVFIDLTHITQERLDSEGVATEIALQDFQDFVGDAMIWSWGKDDIYMLGQTCYIQGIPMPFPPSRFDNISKVLLAEAGVPLEDILKTNSGRLANLFGCTVSTEGMGSTVTEHDAIYDARSIVTALQYLVSQGRLNPTALAQPMIL